MDQAGQGAGPAAGAGPGVDPVRAHVLGGLVLLVAAVLYVLAEPGLPLLDGVYLAAVAVSTIGFGDDLAPASAAGRLVTMALALFGLGFCGGVLVPMWAAVRRHLDGQVVLGVRLTPERATAALFAAHLVLGAAVCAALARGRLSPAAAAGGAGSALDPLYFAVAASTTLGAGDYHPTTPVGKALVAVYALLSLEVMANVAEVLGERLRRLCARP